MKRSFPILLALLLCLLCACGEPKACQHEPGPAPTCTEPQVCTKCGETLQPALGH